MGSRAILIVCRDRGCRARAVRGPRRRGRHLLHADGPAVLRGRGAGARAAGSRSRRARPERVLGAVQHELGVPRLRADALVGEGAGAGAAAVRVGRNGGARRPGGDRRRARSTRPRAASTSARLLERHKVRQDLADRFAQAYRHYCWPVESLRDIRIAPFHVMATEGAVHTDKDHVWHMDDDRSVRRSADERPVDAPRRITIVDLADPASEAAATAWWTTLTETRRRRRGRQAAVVRRDRLARSASAGGQVPRPRVSADHLRPGIHAARAPRAAARARPVRQALAGAARVRAGHRRPRTVRAARAAPPRPRVRLRRPRPRKRTGRSAPLTPRR